MALGLGLEAKGTGGGVIWAWMVLEVVVTGRVVTALGRGGALETSDVLLLELGGVPETANPSSPATPRVVVGSLTLASQSHYVPEQLEPSSIILPLGSIDSTFSLQSIPSVHVAIARWKHVDTSLQTALGLPTVP